MNPEWHTDTLVSSNTIILLNRSPWTQSDTRIHTQSFNTIALLNRSPRTQRDTPTHYIIHFRLSFNFAKCENFSIFFSKRCYVSRNDFYFSLETLPGFQSDTRIIHTRVLLNRSPWTQSDTPIHLYHPIQYRWAGINTPQYQGDYKRGILDKSGGGVSGVRGEYSIWSPEDYRKLEDRICVNVTYRFRKGDIPTAV